MSEFTVTQASRKAVPMLISLSGTSGSGKTFSGLLLAAGIAGNEKVGMIDAENGRGTLYEDDPAIRAALPNGYSYLAITPQHTPARYVAALRAMEESGVKVCLIDSTTHEWEGEGGCCDIAENNKLKGMPNWAMAKREHKKFLAYCLSSPMHIIFCLRARDKVKITPDNKVIPIGIQPIAEKNFVFEMLLSLMFDETSHHYSGLKVPKMLNGMFRGGELITKEHGAAIRKWADGGAALGPAELLQKRARAAADLGLSEYSVFFADLPAAQKRALVDLGYHHSNKELAERADREAVDLRLTELESQERFYAVLGSLGYENIAMIPTPKRAEICRAVEEELLGEAA
jgi:hypothetical protein